MTTAAADIKLTNHSDNRIEFATETGKSYTLTAIPAWHKKPVPEAIRINRSLNLSWDFGEPVNIWRASDSSPTYDLIAMNVADGHYTDRSCDFAKVETLTYKITRADTFDASSPGAYATLNHSTQLERERYRMLVRQLNAVCQPGNIPDYLGE